MRKTRLPAAADAAIDVGPLSFKSPRGLVEIDGPLRIPCGRISVLQLPMEIDGTACLRAIAGIGPKQSRPTTSAHVVFVPDDELLFDESSLEENLTLPLTAQGVGRRRARALATQALSIVGQEGLKTADVTYLSGGQRRLLAVARAWCLAEGLREMWGAERRVAILLVRPFEGLHPETRMRMLDALQGLAARGIGVLVFEEALEPTAGMYVLTPACRVNGQATSATVVPSERNDA